ncbi:MAG: Aldo/keto reductase [Pedosphaera sp.]|nr:Aldo/keto reductase [Pedosphaera sp.]
MQTISLGVSSLLSSRLAYGCWRLAGTWVPAEIKPEDEIRGRKAVITAYEAGYTLFDHADIYCRGHAERIFGEAMKQVSGMREKILIATKCGVRFADDPAPGAPGRYDFSAEHIIRSCESSLKRLGIETIDLYQLHRPDLLCDPDEVAGAFVELKKAGKVRYFGVSNFRPSLVTALQVACPMPLVVNQVEISLAHLDCFNDGTLDQCLAEKMTPLAWSPLARGMLGDGGTKVTAQLKAAYGAEKMLPVLDAIAAAHNTSRTVIALAWLLKHPSKIVPIVGSTNPDRIREAVKAPEVELTREEWYRLLLASRGEPLP